MKIQLTVRYALAFIVITFLFGELHELAHTSVGRLICGCWGERDFNGWGLCDGCSETNPIAVMATFAGPIFTFILIWIGFFLLKLTNTNRQKSIGFLLVFANIPFARILTSLMGGGDEVFGLNKIIHNHPTAWVIGVIIVILLSVFPLYRAYNTIHNSKRIAWFILFLLMPVAFSFIFVLGVMNNLLSHGILAEYWILGSPKLITVWTIVLTVLVVITKKYVYDLEKK